MNKVEINRNQLIDLSNAAYQLGNLEIARKLLIAWLKEYPNDLWIRYRLAIVLYKSGKLNEAIRLCEIILKTDPEFTEVWALVAVLYQDHSDERKKAALQVKRLKAYEREDQNRFSLGNLFGRNSSLTAASELEGSDEFDVISAVRLARSSKQQEDINSYFRLLKIYLRRWPKAVQFKLLLGDMLVKVGKEEEGTRLIHSTIESDLLGQVANRIWNNKNPYADLWHDESVYMLNMERFPLPLKVLKKAKLDKLVAIPIENGDGMVSLGIRMDPNDSTVLEANEGRSPSLSSLQPSELAEESFLPEPIEIMTEPSENPSESKLSLRDGKSVQIFAGLGKFFGNKKKEQEGILDSIREFVYKLDVKDADDRFPVYVVMSTIAGLTAKYGKNNKDFIDREMRMVADTVGNRDGWNAMVFYPDEFQSNGKSLLDPQSIRNALIRLDQTLAEKGSMIGALLIVGGHDVVPFFSLANPAMDDDLSILSDVPYSSSDPAKIIDQQWQTGRIPGDKTNDPGLLLSQLRSIQDYHLAKYNDEQLVLKKKLGKPASRTKLVKGIKNERSFGYCAAVWQKPSVAIFRNISDSAGLLTSPATLASNFPSSRLEGADYAYFNLHGIKGQPNWYGQKDSRDLSPIPMIPVALEIKNIQPVTQTPKIVFAENCYGAEIINRSENNALSLNMLSKGTKVFIGSTAISYGAMNLPLTAADLLSYLFWKHLMTGISCGEAFRRARKNMAAEIESGHGALDAEIQKTLISFVLYGDPLYAVLENADITDRMQRAKSAKKYELLKERMDSKLVIDSNMARRIYDEVKQMYEMQGVSDEFSTYTIQKQVGMAKSGDERAKIDQNHNYVIIYSKDTKMGSMLDRLITRVTVSKEGKIRKVSFSR